MFATLKLTKHVERFHAQEVLETVEPAASTGEKRATGENTESTLTEPVVPSEGTAEMDAVDLSMALRKLQVRTHVQT